MSSNATVFVFVIMRSLEAAALGAQLRRASGPTERVVKVEPDETDRRTLSFVT